MLKEFRESLQYRLNRVISRGSLIHIVILVLLVLLVVALGMNAYFFGLFSDSALAAEGIEGKLDRGLLDTIFWSLKHVVDPGAFGDDYGAPLPVILISLLISILGLGIFGTLIAFISATIQRRLDAVQRGNTAVVEHGHIIILGWSIKILFILDFLASRSERSTVAILASEEIEHMQTALRLRDRPWRNVDVVLRTGSTSSIQDLSRMSIDRAASIIRVSQDSIDGQSGHSDIETIKTLMLLATHDGWGLDRPGITAEIGELRNVEMAEIAGGRQISIVSSSEIISKAIVQSARQQGISSVYNEIFASEGNSVRVHNVPQAVSKRFGDVAYWFLHAIPIGICWTEGSGESIRRAAALNPEPDYEISEDEQLILLHTGGEPQLDTRLLAETIDARPETSGKPLQLDNLCVLGWNENIDEIFAGLDTHSARGARITVVSCHSEKYMRDYLARKLPGGFRNIEVNLQQGDLVDRVTLERLNLLEHECLVTLADRSWGKDDPDSRTIITLLLLTDIFKDARTERLPHVVTELLDTRNRELLKDTIASDIIVTPEMISLQLTQIARNPVLGSIYRELLSAGGIEIGMRPVQSYAPIGDSTSFRTLIASAQQRKEITLGVYTGRDSNSGMQLNPCKSTCWQFEAGDQVIVMAQQVYM